MHLEFSAVLNRLTEVNESFDKGILRIAYTGSNRNHTYISQEAFERAIPSMYCCPIVANYIREEDAMMTSPKKNSKSSIKSQTPKSKGKNLLSNSDQKSSRSKRRKNSTTTSLSKPPSENTSIHSPPHFSQNNEIQSNIDEKSLNSLLIQITKNLHFEQYKVKPKKVTNPINSRQNKFEQFTHFQYDFSLYKSIDIEIVSQIPKSA